MKRGTTLPALDLNKQRLLDIEKEVSEPWNELKSEIVEKVKAKLHSHNIQVRKSGYSFLVSTDSDISKKIFSKNEIDSIANDQESKIFKSELNYPARPPIITYKDDVFETNEPKNIEELYRCNIKSHFKYITIEIFGINSKLITLTFSSDSSAFRSSTGNSIKVNYPNDESVGVVERLKSLLTKYEAPRSIFHGYIFRIIFQVILPVSSVFAFNKLYKIVAPLLIEKDIFYTFITLFLYFLILFISAVYFDKLYNYIVPSTILSDCSSDKKKWIKGEGLLFILGIIGIDYIIKFFKWLLSLLK